MSTGYKILVVDDEEDILEILRYNLEKEGYEVRLANDGIAALSIAETFNPDLIILDIMMPGMDGIEVCQKLRSEVRFKDTLIAFLTARSEAFTQITALDSGGDDFINKPIKPNVLKSRINALLRRKAHSSGMETSNIINIFGELEIDYEQFKVSIRNRDVRFSKKNSNCSHCFHPNPEKCLKEPKYLLKYGKRCNSR